MYTHPKKSKKTYEHVRSHVILPLPSIVTLDKYLANTKGMYGFPTSTFKVKYLRNVSTNSLIQ